MCTTAEHLVISWPCASSSLGWPFFTLTGTSASGSPIYSNGDHYIYHDRACDGNISHESGSRWVIDTDLPDWQAHFDLDADGACDFEAYTEHAQVTGPPSGTTAWHVFCG